MRLFICGLVLVAGVASESAAQELGDAPEPVVYVRLTTAPQEIRGRLVRMGDEAVVLRMDSGEVSLPLATVRRIQREGDSVANGALIGALVLGIRCALICGQGMSDSGRVPLAVLTTAGLGALIGAGIDRAHVGRTTIYPYPPTRRQASRPDPAPGLAFTVRF